MTNSLHKAMILKAAENMWNAYNLEPWKDKPWESCVERVRYYEMARIAHTTFAEDVK